MDKKNWKEEIRSSIKYSLIFAPLGLIIGLYLSLVLLPLEVGYVSEKEILIREASPLSVLLFKEATLSRLFELAKILWVIPLITAFLYGHISLRMVNDEYNIKIAFRSFKNAFISIVAIVMYAELIIFPFLYFFTFLIGRNMLIITISASFFAYFFTIKDVLIYCKDIHPTLKEAIVLIGKGLMFGIILILFTAIINSCIPTVFMYGQWQATRTSPEAFMFMIALNMVFAVLLTMFFGSLVNAIIKDSKEFSTRIKRLIVPATTFILAVIINLSINNIYASTKEGINNIRTIVEKDKKEYPPTVICFMEDKTFCSSKDDKPNVISEIAVEQIQQYLLSHDMIGFNNWTENPIRIRYQKFYDVEKQREYMAKSSSLTDRALLVDFLYLANAKPENKKLADSFYAPQTYYYGELALEKMAKIYARMQMNTLLDKVWTEYVRRQNEKGNKKINDKPKLSEIIDGTISGEVKINNKAEILKVALFQANVLNKQKAQLDKGRVVDSIVPDSKGEFKFEYLQEGEYVLAVVINQPELTENFKHISFSYKPDKIIISTQKRHVVIPAINIQIP